MPETPQIYQIETPWPVSTNRIWRAVKGRVIKSKEYRGWLESAALETWAKSKTLGPLPDWLHFSRLRLVIMLQPDSVRPWDCDNRVKSTQDMLESAGIIRDDSQIDELLVVRLTPGKEKYCLVQLTPHTPLDLDSFLEG